MSLELAKSIYKKDPDRLACLTDGLFFAPRHAPIVDHNEQDTDIFSVSGNRNDYTQSQYKNLPTCAKDAMIPWQDWICMFPNYELLKNKWIFLNALYRDFVTIGHRDIFPCCYFAPSTINGFEISASDVIARISARARICSRPHHRWNLLFSFGSAVNAHGSLRYQSGYIFEFVNGFVWI